MQTDAQVGTGSAPETKTPDGQPELETFEISGTREYGFTCTVKARSAKEAYQVYLAAEDESIPDFALSSGYEGRVETVTRDPAGPNEEDMTEEAELEN